jgi:hypothetical protein
MSGSKYLSATQMKGLLKVGDVLIPGDRELPSFSASNCAGQVDRMLAYMHDPDRNAVKLVLTLFRFLPRFTVKGMMWVASRHARCPELLAGALRMLTIGIKGMVMTLYYSDIGEHPSIHQIIRWDAKVVER